LPKKSLTIGLSPFNYFPGSSKFTERTLHYLAILKHKNFIQNNTVKSVWCKREFEKNYIPANKKTYKFSYAQLFTKKIIDDRRVEIPELDAILKAMHV
jgi:hypothetical protein